VATAAVARPTAEAEPLLEWFWFRVAGAAGPSPAPAGVVTGAYARALLAAAHLASLAGALAAANALMQHLSSAVVNHMLSAGLAPLDFGDNSAPNGPPTHVR